MKKITSTKPIPFALSGSRKLVITPEGELVTDAEARILQERLGVNITITDMEPDQEVVPGPEATPAEPAPTPEPLPAEALASEPAEPTEPAA